MPDNNEIDHEVQNAVNSIMKSVNAGKAVSDSQMRTFLSAVGKATDGMKDVEFTSKSVAQSFKSTASGLRGFAGSLAGGNTAFTVVNTAIRGVSDGLGHLAKMIPIVGDGIAGLVGQVGKAAEFSVEQIEAGYGAFNQLSDIGLIGSKGIKGLAKDFGEAGIPLKTYTSLLSNSSKQLAALSGTAHDVSGSFAETMGAMRKETRDGINGMDMQLRSLGYSTEDIAETFLNYADIQRRLGREQSLNSQQLQAGTEAYAKELDLVAKLTGMSRKEQQKVVEAAMAESRWRATIQDMNPKQVIQMNALNNGLSAFSSELAQGMRDQSTGFTQSEAAQKLFRSTNGASAKIQQQLNAGQITGVQALEEYQKAISANMGTMKSLAIATGNQAGIFTNYAKNADFVSASFNEFGEAIKTQADQTTATDDLTAGAVKAVVSLEDANTKIASMFMNSDNAASALEKFAGAANLAAEAAYNLFLDNGSKIKPITRNATETESALQSAKQELNALNDSTNYFSKWDEKDKLQTKIDTLTEQLESNKVDVGSIFSEFGLGDDYWTQYKTDKRGSDHEMGFDHRRQAQKYSSGVVKSHLTPESADLIKDILASTGKMGEELIGKTNGGPNREMWKDIGQVFYNENKTKIDYDPSIEGVQDTVPKMNNSDKPIAVEDVATGDLIKKQTDSFTTMNAKLDSIALNIDKISTTAKQALASG